MTQFAVQDTEKQLRVNRISALTGILSFLLPGLAILFAQASKGTTLETLGDFLVGLTAPFITFALFRRKGVNTWATSLVWHAVALADVIVALALSFLASNSVLNPSPALLLPFTFLTAHILCFVLLTRHTAKAYYIEQL